MFAARREHIARVSSQPWARGEVGGFANPFNDATWPYQGGGRGLDKTKFLTLEHWVLDHLQPDLTLLFDLPLTVARERIALANRTLDRFEQERADFHERVRQAYLDRAQHFAQRMRVINASRSLSEIQKTLEEIIKTI